MPGYGFSGKPTTPGWDPARMACWPPLSVQMTAPFRMPMSGT
jgi:hypothetical protein